MGDYYSVFEATTSQVPYKEDELAVFFWSDKSVQDMKVRLISTYHEGFNISGGDTLFHGETTAIEGMHPYLEPVIYKKDYTGYAEFILPDVGIKGWHPNYLEEYRSYTIGGSARWMVQYFNGLNWINIFSFYQRNYYLGVVNEVTTLPNAGGKWT